MAPSRNSMCPAVRGNVACAFWNWAASGSAWGPELVADAAPIAPIAEVCPGAGARHVQVEIEMAGRSGARALIQERLDDRPSVQGRAADRQLEDSVLGADVRLQIVARRELDLIELGRDESALARQLHRAALD